MKKNIQKQLYPWIWKWHFIGGIVSAPIILMLSITGLIYLFKDKYEAPQRQQLLHIEQPTGSKMNFQQQWDFAKANWDRTPTGIVLPTTDEQATEFISGKFAHKSSLYLNPYAQKIVGTVNLNETDMFQVRKLHGELLMGDYGTKVVELVACWMVVLIITGIFLFWPRGRGWKALFTIRKRQSKRILYRDLHAVLGFWFSFLLLLVLAGGLPWTDVFGAGLKWVQHKTGTGYPVTWGSNTWKSVPDGSPMSLDDMLLKAERLHLDGKTMIDFPQDAEGAYIIYNDTSNLPEIRKIHVDQYSGEILAYHTWADIGILMQARLWAMAFHQGEFGVWNWYLMIFVSIALSVLSIAAVLAYFYRKKPGSWSIPKAPDRFRPSIALVVVFGLLGILLPLFGLSIIVIFVVNKLKNGFKKEHVVLRA